MDSLGSLLGKLKPNNQNFKEKLIKITSVYCDDFDSDTVLMYLNDGVLMEDLDEPWVVDIINDETIMLNPDIICQFPENIEEFRAMCKAHGLRISLNTQTAMKIYG